jgi:hypothetical protein
MNDTQRGADGGEGRDGMVTFFDAVADDPEMTPEQKIHWLRITAADYLEKLESAEMDAKRDRTLAEGHQMRFDALLETMQREAAKSEAIEQERDALREVVALMDIDGKRQSIRDERVDSIVKSLCEQHGYGAVMDSAARQWRAKDPAGAFLIGPCVATAQAVVNAHPTEASSPASEEDGCE